MIITKITNKLNLVEGFFSFPDMIFKLIKLSPNNYFLILIKMRSINKNDGENINTYVYQANNNDLNVLLIVIVL